MQAPHFTKGKNEMKKLIAITSALALGLGVAACDSAKENAAEDAGEQNAEAVNDS